MLGKTLRFMIGLICGVLLTLAGQLMASNAAADRFEGMALLQQVVKQIRFYYVDDKTEKELINTAIEGMLDKLDPYSSLLDTEQLESLYNSTTGEYRGIGIEVSYNQGEVSVIAPIYNSPAYRAGIRSGDVILSCNGVPLSNTDIKFVHRQIKTAKGKIALEIRHKNSPTVHRLVLEPEVINIDSVSQTLLSNNIGYIRIYIFQEQTKYHLQQAIAVLKQQQPELKGLILDLRDNPGGVLNAAIDVSDLFLEEGLIVSTQGRYLGASYEYYASASVTDVHLPLMVLINQGSASASEILAAALQQNHRASLLGSTTFGKGLIQSLIPLDDLDMTLKMTTARYYTPDGHSIHEKGVVPDMVFATEEMPKRSDSPIISPTSALLAKSLTANDPLVNRAVSLLSGTDLDPSPALTKTN